MRTERRLLLALGVLAGLALVYGVSFAVPARHKHHYHHRPHRHRKCLPYFLIPQMKVCAFLVYYVNPDGSRVVMGKTTDLLPMPKPPNRKEPA